MGAVSGEPADSAGSIRSCPGTNRRRSVSGSERSAVLRRRPSSDPPSNNDAISTSPAAPGIVLGSVSARSAAAATGPATSAGTALRAPSPQQGLGVRARQPPSSSEPQQQALLLSSLIRARPTSAPQRHAVVDLSMLEDRERADRHKTTPGGPDVSKAGVWQCENARAAADADVRPAGSGGADDTAPTGGLVSWSSCKRGRKAVLDRRAVAPDAAGCLETSPSPPNNHSSYTDGSTIDTKVALSSATGVVVVAASHPARPQQRSTLEEADFDGLGSSHSNQSNSSSISNRSRFDTSSTAAAGGGVEGSGSASTNCFEPFCQENVSYGRANSTQQQGIARSSRDASPASAVLEIGAATTATGKTPLSNRRNCGAAPPPSSQQCVDGFALTNSRKLVVASKRRPSTTMGASLRGTRCSGSRSPPVPVPSETPDRANGRRKSDDLARSGPVEVSTNASATPAGTATAASVKMDPDALLGRMQKSHVNSTPATGDEIAGPPWLVIGNASDCGGVVGRFMLGGKSAAAGTSTECRDSQGQQPVSYDDNDDHHQSGGRRPGATFSGGGGNGGDDPRAVKRFPDSDTTAAAAAEGRVVLKPLPARDCALFESIATSRMLTTTLGPLFFRCLEALIALAPGGEDEDRRASSTEPQSQISSLGTPINAGSECLPQDSSTGDGQTCNLRSLARDIQNMTVEFSTLLQLLDGADRELMQLFRDVERDHFALFRRCLKWNRSNFSIEPSIVSEPTKVETQELLTSVTGTPLTRTAVKSTGDHAEVLKDAAAVGGELPTTTTTTMTEQQSLSAPFERRRRRRREIDQLERSSTEAHRSVTNHTPRSQQPHRQHSSKADSETPSRSSQVPADAELEKTVQSPTMRTGTPITEKRSSVGSVEHEPHTKAISAEDDGLRGGFQPTTTTTSSDPSSSQPARSLELMDRSTSSAATHWATVSSDLPSSPQTTTKDIDEHAGAAAASQLQSPSIGQHLTCREISSRSPAGRRQSPVEMRVGPQQRAGRRQLTPNSPGSSSSAESPTKALPLIRVSQRLMSKRAPSGRTVGLIAAAATGVSPSAQGRRHAAPTPGGHSAPTAAGNSRLPREQRQGRGFIPADPSNRLDTAVSTLDHASLGDLSPSVDIPAIATRHGTPSRTGRGTGNTEPGSPPTQLSSADRDPSRPKRSLRADLSGLDHSSEATSAAHPKRSGVTTPVPSTVVPRSYHFNEPVLEQGNCSPTAFETPQAHDSEQTQVASQEQGAIQFQDSGPDDEAIAGPTTVASGPTTPVSSADGRVLVKFGQTCRVAMWPRGLQKRLHRLNRKKEHLEALTKQTAQLCRKIDSLIVANLERVTKALAPLVSASSGSRDVPPIATSSLQGHPALRFLEPAQWSISAAQASR